MQNPTILQLEVLKESYLKKIIPGQYASSLSMEPITEARQFAAALYDYIEEKKKENGGESVFRIHAGIKAIACVDNATAEFFFKASPDLLDRDGKKRFGPFAAREQLLKGAHPPVFAAGVKHRDTRGLTDAILKLQDARLVPCFEEVSNRFFEQFEKEEEVSFYDALLSMLIEFSFKWLLDVSPNFEDVIAWYNHSLYLKPDTLFTKLAGTVVQPRCPRHAIQTSSKLIDLIKSSRFYPQYLVFAKENGVSEEELPGLLLFNTVVNSAGGEMRSLFPSLAQLYSNKEVRDRLNYEIPANPNLADLLDNDYLECFHYECLRHYPQPRYFNKIAKKDFWLPAGDNLKYAVKEGELVSMIMPFVNRDSKVFDNPEAFDPDRFEINPALIEKIWGYGIAKETGNPYGCAALETGHAKKVWKMVVAKFLKDYEWTLFPEPDFHINSFYDVRPHDMRLKDFRKKGNQIEKSETDLRLEKDFSEACQSVTNWAVAFSKNEYLKLYGLYKQVLFGDNNQKPPGVVSGYNRLKWGAWTKYKGNSKSEAMQLYIDLVNSKLEPASKPKEIKKVVEERPQETTIEKLELLPVEMEAFSQEGLLMEYFLTLKCNKPSTEGKLDLKMRLKGDRGFSPAFKITLTPIETEDEEAIQTESFKIQIPDIGKPYSLEIDILPHLEDQLGLWHLHDFSLQISGYPTTYTFACFEHVPVPAKEILLFNAFGQLPQYDSAEMKADREKDLEQRRNRYHWGYDHGYDLPGFGDFDEYDRLPIDEQFEDKLISIGYSNLFNVDEEEVKFDSIDDYYKAVADRKEIPRLAEGEAWKSDEEFGRMYLQGSHCNFIKKCDQLPENLNLTEDFYVFNEHKMLKTLMAKDLLFVADYPLLEGMKGPEGRYLSSAIVLLVARPDLETLLPVAIQLTQDKASNPPVFTPQDSESDWLMAKTWARLADTCYQQLISHFLLTHAFAESFAVATYRTLPATHPVYKLILPHVKHTLAIGVLARKYMIHDGGWIDIFGSIGGGAQLKLMEKAYQTYSLKAALNFEEDIKRRGVDNTDTLPNYPYRDDGKLIWSALRDYIKSIVSVYYRADFDVKMDACLQEWIQEFNTKGYKYSDLPNQIESIEELVEMLTSIIFASTAIHGSMNFMQYETYAFLPASPATLVTPPPTQKGMTNENSLVEALPSGYITNGLINISTFLSKRFPEDIGLGRDERVLFSHPDVQFAMRRFQQNLEEVEKIINQRNKERRIPYDIFLPSLVPNSVAL